VVGGKPPLNFFAEAEIAQLADASDSTNCARGTLYLAESNQCPFSLVGTYVPSVCFYLLVSSLASCLSWMCGLLSSAPGEQADYIPELGAELLAHVC
jgi:hypothetical protein